MTNFFIILLSTAGALFSLLAAIGIIRMPDTYLRISVNTKAATLGVGLMLGSAAVFFQEFSVTTRVQAIIIFILLTAPVGAHLIGRTSYFTGNKLWKGSVIDDLKGKYDLKSHELKSDNADGKKKRRTKDSKQADF
ncbi:MAG: monovalent cation/H(+) antiporter subunit G [Psychroflexus sp.]|jgi:multicomponent Na+:H+ antiporter subunit G|nr:monovalent cation/H(+) antiporter subunit G [Psychroflexus sp.]MDR9448404.1 monovalent cation/H(+) antiporter subunit G [Psychroflexus sp.]